MSNESFFREKALLRAAIREGRLLDLQTCIEILGQELPIETVTALRDQVMAEMRSNTEGYAYEKSLLRAAIKEGRILDLQTVSEMLGGQLPIETVTALRDEVMRGMVNPAGQWVYEKGLLQAAFQAGRTLDYDTCQEILGQHVSKDRINLLRNEVMSEDLARLGIRREVHIAAGMFESLDDGHKLDLLTRKDISLRIFDDGRKPDEAAADQTSTVTGHDGREIPAAEFAQLSSEEQGSFLLPPS